MKVYHSLNLLINRTDTFLFYNLILNAIAKKEEEPITKPFPLLKYYSKQRDLISHQPRKGPGNRKRKNFKSGVDKIKPTLVYGI